MSDAWLANWSIKLFDLSDLILQLFDVRNLSVSLFDLSNWILHLFDVPNLSIAAGSESLASLQITFWVPAAVGPSGGVTCPNTSVTFPTPQHLISSRRCFATIPSRFMGLPFQSACSLWSYDKTAVNECVYSSQARTNNDSALACQSGSSQLVFESQSTQSGRRSPISSADRAAPHRY